MAYRITRDPILSVEAEAAVLCVENRMAVTDSHACRQLAEAGGEAFHCVLREEKFLPVGSARAVGAGIGAFRNVILVATPRWENAQGNEMLVLRYCYRNVFRVAGELGCRSVAMPFLSTYYYRYPKEEAVHIALTEAERTGLQVTFAAESAELYRLGCAQYRKPQIRAYIGYYRDYAIFELDNGGYVRVDIRPENREVTRILYFEPCYRVGHDPEQVPLPPEEIERLMRIYAEID